jgi:hypothetical protein
LPLTQVILFLLVTTAPVNITVAAAASDGESGIVAVHVMTPSGVVLLD